MDGRLIISNERVETAEKLVSENPATLETVGEVSLASQELCDRAIAAAKAAYPAWRWLDPREKRAILKRAENILARRATEIARLIAHGEGLPLSRIARRSRCSAPSSPSASMPRTWAGSCARSGTATTRRLFLNKSATYHFHPLGPTLIISPWNFPFLIPMFDVMSSLDGGQHRRPPPFDGDPVHGARHRRDLRRGRPAARRPQRRRLHDAPGRGHDRRSGHPDRHVHRQRRHRQAHHGALQPEPDQPDPRARRQGPDDRPRRTPISNGPRAAPSGRPS